MTLISRSMSKNEESIGFRGRLETRHRPIPIKEMEKRLQDLVSNRKHGSLATTPINKDLIILRKVFDYARMAKIIDGKQIPEIKSLPKPKNLIVKKPSLSISQYRSLVRKLQWKIRKQKKRTP